MSEKERESMASSKNSVSLVQGRNGTRGAVVNSGLPPAVLPSAPNQNKTKASVAALSGTSCSNPSQRPNTVRPQSATTAFGAHNIQPNGIPPSLTPPNGLLQSGTVSSPTGETKYICLLCKDDPTKYDNVSSVVKHIRFRGLHPEEARHQEFQTIHFQWIRAIQCAPSVVVTKKSAPPGKFFCLLCFNQQQGSNIKTHEFGASRTVTRHIMDQHPIEFKALGSHAMVMDKWVRPVCLVQPSTTIVATQPALSASGSALVPGALAPMQLNSPILQLDSRGFLTIPGLLGDTIAGPKDNFFGIENSCNMDSFLTRFKFKVLLQPEFIQRALVPGSVDLKPLLALISISQTILQDGALTDTTTPARRLKDLSIKTTYLEGARTKDFPDPADALASAKARKRKSRRDLNFDAKAPEDVSVFNPLAPCHGISLTHHCKCNIAVKDRHHLTHTFLEDMLPEHVHQLQFCSAERPMSGLPKNCGERCRNCLQIRLCINVQTTWLTWMLVFTPVLPAASIDQPILSKKPLEEREVARVREQVKASSWPKTLELKEQGQSGLNTFELAYLSYSINNHTHSMSLQFIEHKWYVYDGARFGGQLRATDNPEKESSKGVLQAVVYFKK